MLTSEWIPARQESSKRVMIVLHGLGDSIEGYRWLPEVMRLPWLNYLLLNAPDPYYGGFSWFDLYGDPAPGIERSRKLLLELLDELVEKGYPAGQITCFGFSQGCLLCIEVGARYPKRLAAIVGISGYVYQPDKLIKELSPVARRQRFLLTHGTQDPLIPIEQVRPQIAALKEAGLQIEWREFIKPHTIAGEIEMAVVREFVRNGYE